MSRPLPNDKKRRGRGVKKEGGESGTPDNGRIIKTTAAHLSRHRHALRTLALAGVGLRVPEHLRRTLE